jgi:hypothetical protein
MLFVEMKISKLINFLIDLCRNRQGIIIYNNFKMSI